MCCVVLNPVDTFLNRKAKSGVRKIAVAELGKLATDNLLLSYYDTPSALTSMILALHYPTYMLVTSAISQTRLVTPIGL